MTHKWHAFYLLLLFLLLFMNSVIWWTLIPQKSWSRTKSCWLALSWEILLTFKIFNWILLFPCLFHFLLYKRFLLLDRIKVSMSNEEQLLWRLLRPQIKAQLKATSAVAIWRNSQTFKTKTTFLCRQQWYSVLLIETWAWDQSNLRSYCNRFCIWLIVRCCGKSSMVCQQKSDAL